MYDKALKDKLIGPIDERELELESEKILLERDNTAKSIFDVLYEGKPESIIYTNAVINNGFNPDDSFISGIPSNKTIQDNIKTNSPKGVVEYGGIPTIDAAKNLGIIVDNTTNTMNYSEASERHDMMENANKIHEDIANEPVNTYVGINSSVENYGTSGGYTQTESTPTHELTGVSAPANIDVEKTLGQASDAKTIPKINKPLPSKNSGDSESVDDEDTPSINSKNVTNAMKATNVKTRLGLLDSGGYEGILNAYNKNNIVNAGVYNGYRKAHVFMTVPDCRMFDGNAINSTIIDSFPGMAESIQANDYKFAKFLDRNAPVGSSGKTLFMLPLMNLMKSVSNLPSFDLKTRKSSGSMRNNYNKMGVDTVDSLSDNTITLTFEDDRHGTVISIMKLWLDYIEGVNHGLIEPTEEALKNSILDYTTSFYIFITDETNSKIVYWFKLVGCYPKNRDYGFLNVTRVMKERSPISVTFEVSIPEDMRPEIIDDFNYLNSFIGFGSDIAYHKEEVLNEIARQTIYKEPSDRNLATHYVDRFYIQNKKDIMGMNEYHLKMYSSTFDAAESDIASLDAIAKEELDSVLRR